MKTFNLRPMTSIRWSERPRGTRRLPRRFVALAATNHSGMDRPVGISVNSITRATDPALRQPPLSAPGVLKGGCSRLLSPSHSCALAYCDSSERGRTRSGSMSVVRIQLTWLLCRRLIIVGVKRRCATSASTRPVRPAGAERAQLCDSRFASHLSMNCHAHLRTSFRTWTIAVHHHQYLSAQSPVYLSAILLDFGRNPAPTAGGNRISSERLGPDARSLPPADSTRTRRSHGPLHARTEKAVRRSRLSPP